MAARSQQFFHGTTHDVGVGGFIVPANQSGKSNWGDHGYGGQKSSEHAFATESEHTAWRFAEQGRMMKAGAATLAGKEYPGRAKVYTVSPNDQMEKGVYHADHPLHPGGDDLQEWRAPKFRTASQIDTKPGHQGTFPDLNWNQFRSQNSGYMSDMNHPRDDEIHEGHAPTQGPEFHEKFRRGMWDFDQQEMRESGLSKIPVPTADADQLDLVSGRTVEDHAENDDSPLGDYHRNNLFGKGSV